MADMVEAAKQVQDSWNDLFDTWYDIRITKPWEGLVEELSPEVDSPEVVESTTSISTTSSDSSVIELKQHQSVVDEINREEWEQEHPEEESETSVS